MAGQLSERNSKQERAREKEYFEMWRLGCQKQREREKEKAIE